MPHYTQRGTYSPALTQADERRLARTLRRSYAHKRTSHASCATSVALALLPLALIALMLGVAYANATAGGDPHNYAHAKHATCAAFGKLSTTYHNGRCD